MMAKNYLRQFPPGLMDVFFLTKCTSSKPERLVPIAERFGLDPGAVLDKSCYFSILYQLN
ncbi:hypothetical protein RchiOBHm_Chr2g0147961 [Rosa chinensis]|uniref:Uncharacterized protein n=1 Tax=Rosa chinensis TaxID=74649 RepID=A0A2P6RZA0_ROSCH|nr:hypothetical protein RchiOBHm_Chr2g0147961 [Rosa chinensis]